MAHIFYLKSGNFGQPPSPLIASAYDYIGEVKFEDLETIFRAMNAFDGSDIEKYLAEFQCRSMSVGDIVACDHGTFICAAAGWKQLTSAIDIQTIDNLTSSGDQLSSSTSASELQK